MKRLGLAIALFLMYAQVGVCEVAPSGSTADTYATSDTLTLSDFTVGACANGLLRVGTYASSATRTVTALAWGVHSFSLKGYEVYDATYVRIEYWYLLNPSADTADIVVNFSSSGAIAITAQLYCGVDQASPFTDYDSHAIESVESSQLTLDCGANDYADDIIGVNSSRTFAVAGSQNELSNMDMTGNTFGASNLDGTSPSVNMGWTWTTAAAGAHIAATLSESVPSSGRGVIGGGIIR